MRVLVYLHWRFASIIWLNDGVCGWTSETQGLLVSHAMGQQQVKAFAERGRSGKNSKSLIKNKDVEKSELQASSGKPMLSTEMLNSTFLNRFKLIS